MVAVSSWWDRLRGRGAAGTAPEPDQAADADVEETTVVPDSVSSADEPETGRPRLAYRSRRKRDKSQLLLFAEERELERWRELKDDLVERNLSSLTPLEALTFLHKLKKKIQEP